MLKYWLMPQINEDSNIILNVLLIAYLILHGIIMKKEDSNDYIFQQDSTPAHYKDVRGYLN